MATIDSVKTKMQNLLSSLSTKMGTTYSTFNAAINALPSKKTQDNVSASGKTVTTPSGIYFSQVQKSVSEGSATVSGSITANPSIATTATTITAGKAYKMSVSGSKSITPTVTKGYIESGTAGTVTVSGEAYVMESSTGNATASTTDTATRTIGYGQQTTISAGYYPNARIIRNSVGSVSGSIGGSASAGKATAAIENTNNMRTISSPSGTAGTNYYTVKATATGSAGSYTPKYTVSTAGYISSTVTGSAQSVSVTGDSTGESIYIPKASFTTSGASIKTTSTGGGYIPDNTTVGTIGNVSGSIGGSASSGSATAAISNVDGMVTISSASGTAGTDYFRVKATAAGSAGKYTPKYTVSTAGYISSTVTGTAQTVSVNSDSTGKTIYIPRAKFEVSGQNVKTTSSGGGYIPSNTIVGTASGASVGTCTVKLGIGTMDWYTNNNVRVFYTSYSGGAFNTNVEQTSANATSTVTLSNVVCGSAISVWTQVYAYISPSTYTKYTDEYNHCFMCPNSPGQTITIDLLENS